MLRGPFGPRQHLVRQLANRTVPKLHVPLLLVGRTTTKAVPQLHHGPKATVQSGQLCIPQPHKKAAGSISRIRAPRKSGPGAHGLGVSKSPKAKHNGSCKIQLKCNKYAAQERPLNHTHVCTSPHPNRQPESREFRLEPKWLRNPPSSQSSSV